MENAESSLPSTHNKSIYFLLLFFFPFRRVLDISVRAAGMRSRRYKQDSRIKRKFLAGASMLPFSLFHFLLENERKRRNRGGRTPAASARFHDNYLHQIESWLELHGGKQKNPPLARMLTRQQEEEEEDSERDAAHPRVFHSFSYRRQLAIFSAENLGRRVETRGPENSSFHSGWIISLSTIWGRIVKGSRHALRLISPRYPLPWTQSGIVF